VYIYAAESFPDRTEVQCLHRWQKVLDPELIKGPWTQEVCQILLSFLPLNQSLHTICCNMCIHRIVLQEDETIIQKVKEFGPTKWSVIARSLHGRIGKQCRERYSPNDVPCMININKLFMHTHIHRPYN
jgi:myb proto-oncogene protein